MAKNLGINIKIGADTKKFSTDMQNAARDMKKMGQKMQSIGKSMTKAITLPFALAGAASVKYASDFEQSMAKVKAISGATGREFESLNTNALELGRTTRYTAQQVAELQLNLSKLGFKPKEITDATGAILNLALATGEDLASSATTAAATLKGFGLQATDSGMVTDVMAKAFSSSALDLEKFSTAMAIVAPVAKKAGVSVQETTAILGVLTDRGVDASSAGAALRNIYLDLADKGLSWNDAMKQLQGSTNPLSTAMELFGKRGAAVASIIADNVTSVSDLTGTLNNSKGSAKAMADTMDDTLNGSMLRLRSAVEGLAIGIGTTLTPIIRSMTDFVANVADKLNGMSESSRKALIAIAGLVAGIGPLLYVTGGLIKVFANYLPLLIRFKNIFLGIPGIIKLVTPLLYKLGASITAMLGPIGLVSVAAAGLTYAFYKLATSKKEVSAVSKDVIANINTERAGLNAMFSALRATKEGTEARTRAINELNTKYGEYLPFQLTEKTNLAEIATAQTQANQQLLKSIVLKSKANDIEQASARFLEKTKDAMSDLSKEAGKAKLKEGSFTKEINPQQAKAFEIAIAGIIERFKDTSSTEKYQESLKKIRSEINKYEKENGFAVTRTRQFQNALLGVVNSGVDLQNEMLEVNQEYSKMEKLLGITTSAAKGLRDEIEKPLKPQGGTLNTGGISVDSVDLNPTFNIKPSFDIDVDELSEEYVKAMSKVEESSLGVLKPIENVGYSLKQLAAAGAVHMTKFTNSMDEALTEAKQMLASFAGETLTGFLDALGQEMAGSTKAIDRWGAGLLGSFGKFLSEMGAMIMAYGASMLVLQTQALNPFAVIAAGAALVAIGGAIKQHASKAGSAMGGMDVPGNYGFDSAPLSGGYSGYGTNNSSGIITLESVVYGNDIVLASNRQQGLSRRTR